MNSYDIAVIGGDGTGPEVTAENIKVLDAAGQKFGFKLNYTDFDFGGDRYLRTNEVLPDSASDDLRNFPAVILGAIGHPDVAPGVLEKGILLRLRFELEQYINLRPVKLFDERFCPLKDKKPEDVDFVVVRENNEGLYTGSGGFVFKGTPNEVAIQESVNTRRGVERCLRYAFDYTRKRNKDKQLTLCGKTNVLTYAFDLWDRAFHEIGEADYSDIKREYKTGTVKSDDPSLDGDEDIVWCRFPDALLENIQEGKTKLSSIEEMYEKTERTFARIIKQLDAEQIVVGSDHGYVRLDAGNTFPVTEPQKNRLQETFSGRFVSVAEAKADDLVDEGLYDECYASPTTKKLGPEEIAKLKELKELLDNDVLSQAEFEAQKAAVLA